MSSATPETTIGLRIPGTWEHPGELIERMPDGYQINPEALVLPDGTEIAFFAMQPDDQFAKIFASSCRKPATDAEFDSINSYSVNVGLCGPGGSIENAIRMMQAGAAIIQAGGAGVFIDNSCLAHGGGLWQEMTEIGGPDALSFGYVSIVAGAEDVTTMGMHVLGLPEVVMSRADAESDEMSIIDMIRYLVASDKPVGDGHILADPNGARFQAKSVEGDQRIDSESPMFNPWGRLSLISIKDIAESN